MSDPVLEPAVKPLEGTADKPLEDSPETYRPDPPEPDLRPLAVNEAAVKLAALAMARAHHGPDATTIGGYTEMARSVVAAVAALQGSGISLVEEPPVLTSLSPATAVSGATDDIVMSCIGTGFNEETEIVFGNYDEPTTFVSPTEVTTVVKPSLFVAPDNVPVRVHNGDLASEAIDFVFTAAPASADTEGKQAVLEPA